MVMILIRINLNDKLSMNYGRWLGAVARDTIGHAGYDCSISHGTLRGIVSFLQRVEYLITKITPYTNL